MKSLLALLAAGCVAREPVHPVYRYDYTESRSYDCPHASDKPDPRCEEGPKKDQPTVQSSTSK